MAEQTFTREVTREDGTKIQVRLRKMNYGDRLDWANEVAAAEGNKMAAGELLMLERSLQEGPQALREREVGEIRQILTHIDELNPDFFESAVDDERPTEASPAAEPTTTPSPVKSPPGSGDTSPI
jgi:hypothetical protein